MLILTSCIFSDIWLLQAENVCYKSRGEGYGQFTLLLDGTLKAIKLVHKSGGLTCIGYRKTAFGCATRKDLLLVILTTQDKNELILPNSGITLDRHGFYTLPGLSRTI